jgi:cellobionic acid phosphorylase
MPSKWEGMKVRREFRGAVFEVEVKRGNVQGTKVVVDGEKLHGNMIKNIEVGRTYKVDVEVSQAKKTTTNGVSNGSKANGKLTNGNATNGTK